MLISTHLSNCDEELRKLFGDVISKLGYQHQEVVYSNQKLLYASSTYFKDLTFRGIYESSILLNSGMKIYHERLPDIPLVNRIYKNWKEMLSIWEKLSQIKRMLLFHKIPFNSIDDLAAIESSKIQPHIMEFIQKTEDDYHTFIGRIFIEEM